MLEEPRTLEEAEEVLKELARSFRVVPSTLPPREEMSNGNGAPSENGATTCTPAGGEKAGMVGQGQVETASGANGQHQAQSVSIDRLQQTEARYRTLVEQIPAITFMASLQDGLAENEIYVSPHIETMLGFTQAEWLGDPFLWYRQLHPDDRARWGAEFARTCSSGVNFRSEYRFLSRDNREVWVHGEARVVRDEQGRPLFLQGIAFDITESKRAEAALRRSAEELERKVRERTADLQDASLRAELASRARASFLANMSHEIRTPLNGIIGFAELLRRDAESNPAERAEWLEIIHSSGKHLLALINDILDLSKIDAGKLSVEIVACSPTVIIEEVCSILRSKAEEKGLRLGAFFDGPMPRTIQTDPTRFRQVLMNITGNAIKFTASGSVRITARIERATGRNPKLIVEITDTGIGIPADKLDLIFDPFTQADSSITRQFGGTGLGLAISERLAEQLGGGITVKSEVGKGTTFLCEFDTGQIDLGSVDQGGQKANVGRSALKAADSSRGKAAQPVLKYRILVVDDGDTNRKLVKLVLGRAGAQVEQAENGQQAIERALAAPFDVILMDMQMPVMDGYAATRELRARGLKTPIIAMTANAMKGDDAKCRDAGCTDYLSKPIDQDLLLAVVAAAVENARAAPAKPVAEQPSPFPKPRPLRDGAGAHAATGRPSSGGLPDALRSTLPMDDDEFRLIVEQFAARLREKISAMQVAYTAGDLPELAGLGHWLKGTSGTVGFQGFIATAQRLEDQARAGRLDDIEDLIAQIEEMAGRIVLR